MLPDATTQAYVARLGFQPADIWRGCDECAQAAPWTQAHAANAVRAALATYVLRAWIAQASGRPGQLAGTVRGWWRCRPCNVRRDGAADSKHIAAGAIDVDYTSSEREAFRRILAAYGADTVAAWLARIVGVPVGLIRYPSGAIHLDAIAAEVDGVTKRTRNYVSVS